MMDTDEAIKPLNSPNEITEQWLEKILSHKMRTSVTIQSWKVNIPESKDGFLSEICFVQVSFKAEDTFYEKAIVVKSMPLEKERVEFIKVGRLGEREVRFYMHARSKDFINFCQQSGLGYPVPDVYGSCLGGDLLTIILSDLSAEGYRMYAPAEGNSLQQVISTFESIATIHAFGFAFISKHGSEDFHIPFESSYLDEILNLGMCNLINFFSKTPVAKTLNALLPYQKIMINISNSYPLIETLVHGDLWAGNVMFADNDKRASVFDWQFAKVDNPLCDVTTMLLMSAEPTVYEEHLTEVLKRYWESFTNALIKNGFDIKISLEDVISNLEKMWMHGFMFFTASFPDMLGNKKITEERIQRVISFLENRGVFSRFLELHRQ